MCELGESCNEESERKTGEIAGVRGVPDTATKVEREMAGVQ